MALRTPLPVQPSLYMTDTGGRPLDGGKVYFGEPNTDPELYPIDIFYDETLSTAASQPVATKNGFLSNSGNTIGIYAKATNYSVKVLDAFGMQVLYVGNMTRLDDFDGALTQEIDRATTAEQEIESLVLSKNAESQADLSDLDTKLTNDITSLEVKDASLQNQINSVGGGKKAYTTEALMIADKANIAANSSVDVTNDPTASKNGTYAYDGTVFTKSAYDPQAVILSKVISVFDTHAIMIASPLPDNSYAFVSKDGDDKKNGHYQKQSGIWVYLDYNNSASESIDIYKTYDGVSSVVQSASNSYIVMSITDEASLFFDSRTDEMITNINELFVAAAGVTAYKTILGFAEVSVSAAGNAYVITDATSNEVKSLVGATQKTLVAGDNIGIIETPTTITISATADSYATPYEFVLCLIAGQSNASYFGGDASLAPALPNGVMYIWDNVRNTLHDINDATSPAADTAKQTFAPAIALEFYKKTGMGLIVVNSAVGSTAQVAAADNGAGNWSSTGTLRQAAIDNYAACQAHLLANNYCYQNGFTVWAQGEQDALKIADSTITKADYKSELIALIDYFQAQIGSKLPFVMVRTAYRQPDNIGYQSVRDAQMETAAEKNGAYMGYTGTTKFFERGLMDDSVHYDQIGKNIIGKHLGKITTILSAGVN